MSPGDISSLTINSNSSITGFSFLMVVFLALMNLKFQPQRNIESPFETQGVVMAMFVICMLVYSITFCTPYFLEVIDDINLLAGSLATVLLTFTLFPPLGWLILFIWTIHFVKLIYGAIPKLCELCQALPSLFNLRVLLGRHAHHNEERCCNNHVHASLGFLISVLLALIQVKYQSTNMAVPFETHPEIMFIFITAILVYAATAAIKTSNGNSSIHRIIVTKISLLSGSLATVVLLLVIVPPIGWFILLIWTFFLVKQINDVIDDINLLAGSLATVLLTFTLFPALGWVVLFIWTIHFVKLTYGAIPKLCELRQALPSQFNLRVLLGRHAHHNEERCCNNHIHASLGFLISVLLALIQVKCQSTNMAVPFETHPAIMFIFITAILVYAATAAIKTSNDNSSIHRIIVTKISLLSGSLATFVLLLVILPPIGWLILLIWTFFLVKQIYDGMLYLPCLITLAVIYVICQILRRGRHLNQGGNRLSV